MNPKDRTLVLFTNLTAICMLILVATTYVAAQSTTAPSTLPPTGAAEATSIICNVLRSIRMVVYIIAGGIGVVVITIQGIKWVGSADDPGARKQAKEGIIHAIVGLIIVLVAIALVSMVFSGGCPMT